MKQKLFCFQGASAIGYLNYLITAGSLFFAIAEYIFAAMAVLGLMMIIVGVAKQQQLIKLTIVNNDIIDQTKPEKIRFEPKATPMYSIKPKPKRASTAIQ